MQFFKLAVKYKTKGLFYEVKVSPLPLDKFLPNILKHLWKHNGLEWWPMLDVFY